MKSKKVIALLTAAVMTLSLAACGGSSDGSSSNGGSGSEQVINTYLEAEPTTLDPSRRSDQYSSDILMNVMEGLIRIE